MKPEILGTYKFEFGYRVILITWVSITAPTSDFWGTTQTLDSAAREQIGGEPAMARCYWGLGVPAASLGSQAGCGGRSAYATRGGKGPNILN